MWLLTRKPFRQLDTKASLKQYLLAFFLVLLAETAVAGMPEGAVYLDAGDSKLGIVLCHGRGKHPRWKVVEPLRIGLHEALNAHTISLQMPVVEGDWTNYKAVFPEAARRIDDAAAFLQKEHGINKLLLIGHSMGARMTSNYLANLPDYEFAGLVVVGCRNNGGYPLNCKESLQDLDLPILDIWGTSSRKDVRSARERKILESASYMQVPVEGADHRFDGEEGRLLRAVINWLRSDILE